MPETSDLYGTLGVARDAPPEEIKRAYRRKAKTAHPDAGGSAEKFGELTRAHRILSDGDKREKYDRTGKVDDEPDQTTANAMGVIDGLFVQAIGRPDALQIDIVQHMRAGLSEESVGLQRQLVDVDKAVKDLDKLKARIKRRGDGDNLLARMMEAKIAAINAARGRLSERMEVVRRAKEILADYEDSPERRGGSATYTTTKQGAFFR